MKLNITDILMAPQIISQASLLSYYLEDLIVYLMHLLEHLTDIPNLTWLLIFTLKFVHSPVFPFYSHGPSVTLAVQLEIWESSLTAPSLLVPTAIQHWVTSVLPSSSFSKHPVFSSSLLWSYYKLPQTITWWITWTPNSQSNVFHTYCFSSKLRKVHSLQYTSNSVASTSSSTFNSFS